MDLLLSIFSQLGVDSSLLFQFLIFVIFYFVSKFLFFGHLQNVLENRFAKTEGLELKADKQLSEANNLANKYKEAISEAKKNARSKMEEEKMKISKEAENKFRTEEKSISDYIEKERGIIKKDFEQKRKEIMSESEVLTQLLVKKITKE